MILDSDILIYFLKGRKEIVREVLKIPQDQLFITRINYTELLYGAYNSQRVEKNLQKIVPFLDNFTLLEFDQEASVIFAQQKAKLKKSGNIIADMDLMIASIALANHQPLYTNNVKHFERIEGLSLKTSISL
ncbi:VapC toxin protein [hydrothermal vent metagenome]|uniref:VapC toxin protein n=1 Tax=hydrothermal vent metagenome TaxID=652676 RepID=A0A1W1C408_9ZZZZ